MSRGGSRLEVGRSLLCSQKTEKAPLIQNKDCEVVMAVMFETPCNGLLIDLLYLPLSPLSISALPP